MQRYWLWHTTVRDISLRRTSLYSVAPYRDELENIFQRFHRVASTGRSHEGTGIGLSLAHETVKALGGRFEVESEYGEGSTFRVILPLGTEHVRSTPPGYFMCFV